MKTVSFAVHGMMCEHCKASVERALVRVNGVQSAESDLDAKTVTVVCDDAVRTESLWDAVEAAGFDPVRA